MKKKAKRSRIRRAAGAAARGARNNALQVLAGVGAGAVHSLASSKVSFIGSNWWAGPAGLAVLGILAKRNRRLSSIGDAALGAAGYSAYLGYRLNSSQQPQETGMVVGRRASRYDTGMVVERQHVPGLLDAKPVMSAMSAEAAPVVSEAVETIGL